MPVTYLYIAVAQAQDEKALIMTRFFSIQQHEVHVGSDNLILHGIDCECKT